MSCSCSCNTCANLVRSTALAVTGGALRITIPTTPLRNHQQLCVAIAQPIPGTVTPNTTVQIVDGTSTFNIITPCGNYLYADQVRSRRVLHLVIATDVPLAKLTNTCNLLNTSHVFPVIPATTTAVAEVAMADETAYPTAVQPYRGGVK